MIDTANVLLESSTGLTDQFSALALGENELAFNNLTTLGESYVQLLGYTPDKVAVVKTKKNNYLIEYGNNLERLMFDQNITFTEAMNAVSKHYNIPPVAMHVVVEASDVSRIDIRAAQAQGFKFLRKESGLRENRRAIK